VNGLNHEHWTADMWKTRLLMERQDNQFELRRLRNKSLAKAKSKAAKWWVNLSSASIQNCVKDLQALVTSGNLDEGATWFQYMLDTIHNQKLLLVNNDGLRRHRNSKYSETTMDYFRATQITGGPKQIRMMGNVMAPSRGTMQSHVSKKRRVLHPGLYMYIYICT
jgi:hypothetical protein